MSRERVLVALSGGVDSSVAAALLVEAGHDVVGITMKTFCYSETPSHGKTCCGLDGIADAQRVAHRLGIPHYVFDVEEEFTHDVIDDFVSEYARGHTPNPCVRCNSNTKFRDLMRRGEALGAHSIASGHYARAEVDARGEAALLRGVDREKDQAYFLWGLPRDLLMRLRFPLGELTKPAVRERARELGLVTAEKPESQEICFVPTGDYRDLLKRRMGPTHDALTAGPFVDLNGRVVGQHAGYAGFTIGQRRGLPGGAAEPQFVLAIRPASREVVIGPREALFVDEVMASDLNWLAERPRPGDRVQVQLRHRAPPVGATVAEVEGTLRLTLHAPHAAVTPGQSAVLFQGERLIGGGRIRASDRPSRLSA
ncbi:MAG: tRNA 2-thiouridine(34) synthase MnmA [Gemmatimonadota bacterium]